jgi:hypothetical protein
MRRDRTRRVIGRWRTWFSDQDTIITGRFQGSTSLRIALARRARSSNASLRSAPTCAHRRTADSAGRRRVDSLEESPSVSRLRQEPVRDRGCNRARGRSQARRIGLRSGQFHVANRIRHMMRWITQSAGSCRAQSSRAARSPAQSRPGCEKGKGALPRAPVRSARHAATDRPLTTRRSRPPSPGPPSHRSESRRAVDPLWRSLGIAPLLTLQHC